MSRCDNKELSDQGGEILIPFYKKRQNSRREQYIASEAEVREDDLDAGVDSQKLSTNS